MWNSEMIRQITGISSMATRQILADLADLYEQRTGWRVVIRPMGGVEAARLVRAGETADVIILASNVMEQLENEGHLVSGSGVNFARSGVAIAIPAGAPRPDISDEEAVRRAVLGPRTICYSTGPSGDHLMRLLKRWGMAESASLRTVQAPPGVPVGVMVARGEADLGFQQLSELLHVPGIEIVGPLPPDIQAVTVFSAGVSATSVQYSESRALIAYVTSPEADAVKRRYGMEPA
jgi:molybdate transport system substrate-binding protein